MNTKMIQWSSFEVSVLGFYMTRLNLDILKNNSPDENMSDFSGQTILLFTSSRSLRKMNLYDYLKRFGKIHGWSLEDLISHSLVDYNEVDSLGDTLVRRLILDNNLT